MKISFKNIFQNKFKDKCKKILFVKKIFKSVKEEIKTRVELSSTYPTGETAFLSISAVVFELVALDPPEPEPDVHRWGRRL